MLTLEFLEPLNMSPMELGRHLGVNADRIEAVVDGRKRLDAELDLRLARFFGMSPGFFLGLQIDHELLEAKRALNGELDRIIPRAA